MPCRHSFSRIVPGLCQGCAWSKPRARALSLYLFVFIIDKELSYIYTHAHLRTNTHTPARRHRIMQHVVGAQSARVRTRRQYLERASTSRASDRARHEKQKAVPAVPFASTLCGT